MKKNNRKKPVIIRRESTIRVPENFQGDLHPWFNDGHEDAIHARPMRERCGFPGQPEWDAYWTAYNMWKNRPFVKLLKKTVQRLEAGIEHEWRNLVIQDLFEALDAGYHHFPFKK